MATNAYQNVRTTLVEDGVYSVGRGRTQTKNLRNPRRANVQYIGTLGNVVSVILRQGCYCRFVNMVHQFRYL